MTRTQTAALLLALVWAAFVLWSWYTESGPYAWAVQAENRLFGRTVPELTATVLIFLVSGPALYHAFSSLRARATPEERADPNWDVTRIGARAALVVGLACLGIAAAAYLMSRSVPDGTEAPVPVDLDALGDPEPPLAKVTVTGDVLSDRIVSLEIEEEYGVKRVHFAPVIATGTAPQDAGLRVFQRVETFGGMAIAPSVFDRTGYLRAENLPAIVRDEFAARGLTLAPQTYVLQPLGSGARDIYYMVAGLVGLLGFFLLAGAIAARFRKT